MKVKLKDNVTNEMFCEETFATIKRDELLDIDYMKRNELEATLDGDDLVVICKRIDGFLQSFEYFHSKQDIWEVVE